MLADALAVVRKNEARYYEAERYRLKGELLLKTVDSWQLVVGSYQESEDSSFINPQSAIRNPQSEEAEKCFRQAIDIARHQSAKSLELKAVMSLSRLLQKQGRKEEARKILSEIYGWFTEGFDTKDLKEAKALLEELS